MNLKTKYGFGILTFLVGVVLLVAAQVSPDDSTAKRSKLIRLRANGSVIAEVSIRDLDDLSISISAERESIAGRTNGFLIRRYIGAHYKLTLKNADPIDIAAPEIEVEESMPTK